MPIEQTAKRYTNDRFRREGRSHWVGPGRLAQPEIAGSDLARCFCVYAEEGRGAYAPAHFKSMATGLGAWAAWCAAHAVEAYPARPEDLSRFVDETARHCRPTSVQSYLSSINRLHVANGIPPPGRARPVELAVRRMLRANDRERYQALGISFDMRTRMIEAAPSTPKGKRNRAMLASAYDGMLRASEITAVDVSDLSYASDGTASLRLPRSKADDHGKGTSVYLAADTVALIRSWLVHGGITAGTLFKGLRYALRLEDTHVTYAYREMADLAGYPGEIVGRITSHSPRIGAAQDMVAAGIDLAAIMQAARWQTTWAFSRYTQKLAPHRGASAHLARVQRTLGRDRLLQLIMQGGGQEHDRDTENRIATAWHFAGRTWAARALGLPVHRSLSLPRREKDHQRSLRRRFFQDDVTLFDGTPDSRMRIEQAAAAHCAGVEALAGHWREHNRRTHTLTELSIARNLLAQLTSDDREVELHLALVRHRAERLVKADGAATAIGRLANALLDDRRLEPADALRVLNPSS